MNGPSEHLEMTECLFDVTLGDACTETGLQNHAIDFDHALCSNQYRAFNIYI